MKRSESSRKKRRSGVEKNGTVPDDLGERIWGRLLTKGNEISMDYDILVMAVGSIVRQPDAKLGGIALTGLDKAAAIQERWRANLRKAAVETNVVERARLQSVAVAGAGIARHEGRGEDT